MSEEQVTKQILAWLLENEWKIVSFDFPQSGTGKYLHPNERLNETKNEKAFIPDIVAVKGGNAIFFENKNRFYLDDFVKLNDIKTIGSYSNSIEKLLRKYAVDNIFFGIGAVKNVEFQSKAKIYYAYVDFIVLVDDKIYIEKDSNNLFS